MRRGGRRDPVGSEEAGGPAGLGLLMRIPSLGFGVLRNFKVFRV